MPACWLVVKAPTPKVTMMTIAVCRPHARHFCVACHLTPVSCAVPRDGGETKVQRQGPVLRLRSVRAGLSPGTQCPSAQGRAFSLWGRWRNQAAGSEPVAATAWLWVSRQSACCLCASASAPRRGPQRPCCKDVPGLALGVLLCFRVLGWVAGLTQQVACPGCTGRSWPAARTFCMCLSPPQVPPRPWTCGSLPRPQGLGPAGRRAPGPGRATCSG